jgi:protein tyrosine phosphatase (PTP) superfamily phosphohydrolase (DUF442 family)
VGRSAFPIIIVLAAGTFVWALVQRPARPRRVESGAIENLFKVTDRIYSGGIPAREAGFDELRRLGVQTIISVDGARPAADVARRMGLRYVHIPVGYDGIGDRPALQIAKAVRDLPAPVFIHCHHGRHRGPTAAAIACMATEGWPNERAAEWMRLAGTSEDYPGLFRTVRTFHPPDPAQLDAIPDDLQESAEVDDLTGAMVRIDSRWDRLRETIRDPAAYPDTDVSHEATMLWEQFRELGRNEHSAARGGGFLHDLSLMETDAQELRHVIADPQKTGLPLLVKRIEQRCGDCHRRHRDLQRLVTPP